jgi:asparagine synthase (glutamine-hydrolysing)
MCGFAGAWHLGADVPEDELWARATAMGASLRHRGPDDDAVFVDADAGMALAHRRLAVIELSPLGAQPMTTADGRFVLAYNGEIYNHASLRRQLAAAGVDFRGNSDTEVLLQACANWGVEWAVSRALGMFTFALWDRRKRTLALARDHLGVKPLYAGRVGDVVLFGSELRALRCHPDFDATIDRNALAAYLRRACVPAPHTIYTHARKVLPGTILEIGADGRERTSVYWSLEQVARAGLAARHPAPSDRDAVDEAEALLADAVASQMVADVPLGAFLSGGIDSSTVVAMMQRTSSRPVRTYSIGSPAAGYDESSHARAVAEHLGTEHTEFLVTPDDALRIIPRLPSIYDEPFADSSQIPTHLVAALARRDVTVALTGDGGDEVFGGYTRHVVAASRASGALRLPIGLRRAASATVLAVSATTWDRAGHIIPSRRRPPRLGDQLHKAARALSASDHDALYWQLTSCWDTPEILVHGAFEPTTWGGDEPLTWLDDPMERMVFRDLAGYLPDDALTKVDRATMAASLEARVPLLDHRLVEFVWRLPPKFKVRDGRSKWLLRAVAQRAIPGALLDRPKQGFGVPLDEWLRGPLRPWAEDLLDFSRLQQQGFLDAEIVRSRWSEHLAGQRQWQHQLWAVLMWQAWMEQQLAPSP